MANKPVQKTYAQINAKIKNGEVVVVTAEEMVDIVREKGPAEAARQVDVVTTGTFAPMCSSGALINFGHSVPGIKASQTWLNNVPAYAGLAAVDCFIGATEPCADDPLNKVHPGEFTYGGGHVIQDLVAGKTIHLRATAYGTDCYPNREVEKKVKLKDLPNAILCNPRNGYQNYNTAVNSTKKTIYTYMGTLKPGMGNATYCSAGQLSPLFNDPLLSMHWSRHQNISRRRRRLCHLARHPAQARCRQDGRRYAPEAGWDLMGDGGFETNESPMAGRRRHSGVWVFIVGRLGRAHSHSR